MTLKYLWLLDMLPNGLSEAELHVPVDSFILEALKETQQFNTEGNKITGSGESYYYNGEAWSAISDPKNTKNCKRKSGTLQKNRGFPLFSGKALYGLKLHKTEKRERRNKKENKK